MRSERWRYIRYTDGSEELYDHHQDPHEAVEGFEMCAAEHAIGHHWGTFQLTNEAVEDPLDRLANALAEKRIDANRFRTLRPGESWDIPVASETASETPQQAASGNL